MRGEFDLQHSAYPVGYIMSNSVYASGHTGPLYKITDMRTLTPLIGRDFKLQDAVALAARINQDIRDGADETLRESATRHAAQVL